jgi:hypothetical protein
MKLFRFSTLKLFRPDWECFSSRPEVLREFGRLVSNGVVMRGDKIMIRKIKNNRIITDGVDFYKVIGEPFLEGGGSVYKIRLRKLETDEIIKLPFDFLNDLINTGRRYLYSSNRGLSVGAMRLIPFRQLGVTLSSRSLTRAMKDKLNMTAVNIPNLKEAQGGLDVPFILHYYSTGVDFYIKWYDGGETFYGFKVVRANRRYAGLGYFSRWELFNVMPLKLDYYFEPVARR